VLLDLGIGELAAQRFADRAPPQRGSHRTRRWREMDSNYLYRGTKSPLQRADRVSDGNVWDQLKTVSEEQEDGLLPANARFVVNCLKKPPSSYQV